MRRASSKLTCAAPRFFACNRFSDWWLMTSVYRLTKTVKKRTSDCLLRQRGALRTDATGIDTTHAHLFEWRLA